MMNKTNNQDQTKQHKAYLYVRIILTFLFFLGLLISIQQEDFAPNTILVDADIPEGYLDPVIGLNTGEGLQVLTIPAGEIFPEPYQNWVSFGIVFNKQAVLNQASFLLEEAKIDGDLMTSTWMGYIPGYNHPSKDIEGYFIITSVDKSNFNFELMDINWPIDEKPGGIIAWNPDSSGGGYGEIRIQQTNTIGDIPYDLRNISINVDEIYPIEREPDQIRINSITLAKHYDLLGITIPLFVWDASNIASDFRFTDATDTLHILNGILLAKGPLSLQLIRSLGTVSQIIARTSSRYQFYSGLLALLLVILFYLGLGLVQKFIINKSNNIKAAKNENLDFLQRFSKNSLQNITTSSIDTKSLFSFIFMIALAVVVFPFQLPPIVAAFILIVVMISFYLSFPIVTASVNEQTTDRQENNASLHWYRQEKFIYPLALILILAVAFLLRFINLVILDPYTDEYTHLLAAKELLSSGQFTYTRAEFVTRLVALFYSLGRASSFYEYLYWGRLPGVIFGSLTVIPLYLISKKISRPVALVTAFLWAISPWAIGVSKTIREYAYYPFFILTILLLIINGFELISAFKRKYLPALFLIALTVFLFLIYAYFVDTLSTLKINAIIVFGSLLSFGFYNWRNLVFFFKRRLWMFWGVMFLGFAALVGMMVFANRTGHVTLQNVEFSAIWVDYFFRAPKTPLHWWGGHHFAFLGILFIIPGGVWAIKKQNKAYLWPIVIFIVLLLFFAFFFDRYVRPRYIFYVLPFFTILVATSIVALVEFIIRLKPFFKRSLAITIIAVLFLQAFNYQNIFYPIRSDTHGYILTTNEHHDKLGSTIEFMEDKISDQDVFISTIFRYVLWISFDIPENKVYHYLYRNPDRFDFVTEIVEQNSQGFLILDRRRNGHFSIGFPLGQPFYIGDTFVQLVQNKDGMHIYRWER